MTGNDPITAIVDQLAAHAEQLTRLDAREADHHAAASGRLAELTGQTASIGRLVQEHAAALGHLTAPSQTDRDPDGYCPDPAPASTPGLTPRMPAYSPQYWRRGSAR